MSAPPTEVAARLQEGLARLGLRPGADVIDALLRFLVLLQKWNRAYNLTGLSDLDEMLVRHLLDSASAAPYLAGTAILDVGTGAGLPGIPLALLQPQRRFTLLDSAGKKMRFLQEARAGLALANVELAEARIESWQPAQPFDTALCRAFATLGEFAAAAGSAVAPGGRLVAMKGRRPDAELGNLPAPWRAGCVDRVEVPWLGAERHIVVLERSA